MKKPFNPTTTIPQTSPPWWCRLSLLRRGIYGYSRSDAGNLFQRGRARAHRRGFIYISTAETVLMVSHLSGSGVTPDPLRCSCVLGHRRLAPTVVTVTVVITSMLIAAIRVAVAFSLLRCPLVAFFPGARPSYR